MSDILPDQKRNLQQLQNLQNRTRSLGIAPSDYSPLYLQHIQQEQQQKKLQQNQAHYQQQPNLNVLHMAASDSFNGINNTNNTQQTRTTSDVTFKTPLSSGIYQNNNYNNSNNNADILEGGTSQNLPHINTNINGTANIGFQGRNSLASTSLTRTSIHPQKSNQQQDPRSPLVILIPTSSQPTEILTQRFGAWRSIIKSLIIYLTEVASIQDEIVRQQLRLTHSIQFPFFSVENLYQPSSSEDKQNQKFFLSMGNGSIQDLPTILNQYHISLASKASQASKELSNEMIPRLEDLRRDLLVKIKEIKFLSSDFKNSCTKELQKTKIDMKIFSESIEQARYGVPKQDPFLAKIILDRQIKRQITEENFLHEAYDNLENSASELEKVVVMEIQNALTIYARISGQQAQLVFDVLISKLDVGFFNKDTLFEWENFIARDSNFIPPNIPTRKMSSIIYKNQSNPLTYEMKSGFLEKRSKYLKSYSRSYFVLTPSFLHEFKTADRKKDLVPVISLSLNEYSVSEHSKKGSSDFKFILHSKQNGLINRGHNWVFKAGNYDSMLQWYTLIKELNSLSNINDKTKYVIDKLKLDTVDKHYSSIVASQITLDDVTNTVINNENINEVDDIPGITISSPVPEHT